ncbi:uncharacterized protein PHALS_05347 [Plasmopara halstedii]|uniref:Uncharacterized protein n=1 Tax=Plasmopara halstedii TaxID=4781 RepID=A0A0P1A9T6_PLAHL|nr:uncharacterized protein PHALS_05347 [Plasmopara halstedii]CEG37567.1 hypothetical protein PHALS_05347 [Plasmopara halstedii]|eukprot:XP_024573936.1 hypothetical protein PHALS_05347 [Plasmopara halstedii]
MGGGQRLFIDAYIDADSAEPVECAYDVSERVGFDADQESGNDSEAEIPIQPSAAIACCIQLAEFIAHHSNCDKETRALAKVAKFVRNECIQRRTQTTIS